jgi:serine/threonine protein kinase
VSGFRLGRYELIARIATGGMGEIFLARLGGVAGFEKLCVIKRILPHLAADERFRQMLIAEAQIVAMMSHANICHVYELDETDHQLYIVMEYLEGITLLGLMRRFIQAKRPLDLGLVAGVIHQVCEGLHYAHELRSRDGELLRIIHRDVTPSNIFLTESGLVKVHDFGVAKMKNAASTESGAVKGKHAYSAPEQLRGAIIDRRVDIFALGVVTYEMLAGRPLFQRNTDYLTFQAVMRRPLPPIGRADLPSELAPVLERVLALEATQRYVSAREAGVAMIEALIGDRRPWNQVEIGDLVRREFGEEIQRHNSEISAVIQRSGRESARTMPVILQNPSDPDAGDYFAIETGVDAELPAPALPPTSQPMPVTFAGDVPSTNTRRWVRPAALLAAAITVAAGGILGVDRLRASQAVAAVPPAPAPSDPYAAAIHARRADLDRCTAELPARVRLVVSADGRARDIHLEPPAPDGCIERALQAMQYPTASHATQLTITLRRRP